MITQEIGFIAVCHINQADRLAEINRIRVSKITLCSIAISQCTQQECGIHLRRAGVQRLKSSLGRARGQTIIIQILDIGLLPAFQIGKRCCILKCLCLFFRTKQTHQHDASLCTGGRTIKLIAAFRTTEKPQVAQAFCTVVIACCSCAHRQAGNCQHRSNRHSHLPFHLLSSLTNVLISMLSEIYISVQYFLSSYHTGLSFTTSIYLFLL